MKLENNSSKLNVQHRHQQNFYLQKAKASTANAWARHVESNNHQHYQSALQQRSIPTSEQLHILNKDKMTLRRKWGNEFKLKWRVRRWQGKSFHHIPVRSHIFIYRKSFQHKRSCKLKKLWTVTFCCHQRSANCTEPHVVSEEEVCR